MCGRITATFEFSDIRVRWNLDRDLPLYNPRFNITPETSPNIPVIVRHRGGNECRLMHWGLIPSWAQDPTIGNRMINALAESLTEKARVQASGGKPPVHHPCRRLLRVAQGRKAQGPHVGSSQESGAVRTCWPMGRVAGEGT
jgi:putative SOS response-associated peptidase YedK